MQQKLATNLEGHGWGESKIWKRTYTAAVVRRCDDPFANAVDLMRMRTVRIEQINDARVLASRMKSLRGFHVNPCQLLLTKDDAKPFIPTLSPPFF